MASHLHAMARRCMCVHAAFARQCLRTCAEAHTCVSTHMWCTRAQCRRTDTPCNTEVRCAWYALIISKWCHRAHLFLEVHLRTHPEPSSPDMNIRAKSDMYACRQTWLCAGVHMHMDTNCVCSRAETHMYASVHRRLSALMRACVFCAHTHEHV